MDDIDACVEELLSSLEGQTQAEAREVLKKRGSSDAAIDYALTGKLSPQILKQWNCGLVGALGVYYGLAKNNECYGNILESMDYSARVKFLIEEGFTEELAENVAKLVDNLNRV